jgi:hypothetical protein
MPAASQRVHCIALYSTLTYHSLHCCDTLLCTHAYGTTVKREVKPERIERITVEADVKPKPELMSAEPEVMDLCYSSDEEEAAATAKTNVKKNNNSDSEDEYGTR